MKHTKGPWRIEEQYGSNRLWVVAGQHEDEPTLQVLVQDCTLEQAHRHANARLIAAAPEMLEALEDVKRMIESGDWDKQGYRGTVLNEVLNVIAKVRGQTD